MSSDYDNAVPDPSGTGRAEWFVNKPPLVTGAVVMTAALVAAVLAVVTQRFSPLYGLVLLGVAVFLAVWFPGMHAAKVSPRGVARPLRPFLASDRIEKVTLKHDGIQNTICFVTTDGAKVTLMPMADLDVVTARAERIAQIIGRPFVDPNE